MMKNPGRRNLQSTSLPGDDANPIRRMLLLSVVGVLMVCGCNKTPPADNTASSAPPAGSRSLPGARPGTGAAASAPAPDRPQAAAPRSRSSCRSPPPPPPPPPPRIYTVPSGTSLTVRISQELNSKTSNVGDPFSGSLAQSVRVQGVTVLKAGAPVGGTVVAARKQGRFKGEGELGISWTMSVRTG